MNVRKAPLNFSVKYNGKVNFAHERLTQKNRKMCIIWLQRRIDSVNTMTIAWWLLYVPLTLLTYSMVQSPS